MIRKLSQYVAVTKIILLIVGVFGWWAIYSIIITQSFTSGVYIGRTTTYAQSQAENPAPDVTDTGGTGGKCGGGNDQVNTIMDIGCRGRGNPIVDMLFAIIRILSIGVGVVVIGSVIFAGIQYVTSAGDPQNTAKAIERIRNTVIALVLYIFAYALLNWLIPAGLLNQ